MARRSTSSHHVVVGTDFSAASRAAVSRASRIAKDRDAMLHVVHGAGRLPPALRRRFLVDERHVDDGIEAILREARASKVHVTAHRLDTGATNALGRVAREVGADLVVVGTRGRTVPDAVLGSTAERVAASAKRPVLLVRHPSRAAYREVVIATERDGALDELSRWARFVAPSGELSVVRAYQGLYESTLRLHGADAGTMARHQAEARSMARAELLPSMKAAGLAPETLVLRHGDPRGVLLRTPKDALLVMRRGRSAVAHVLLGSVTRSVLAHGHSDVLVL